MIECNSPFSARFLVTILSLSGVGSKGFLGGKLSILRGFCARAPSPLVPLSGERCQSVQRLLKTVNSDDAHVPGMTPGFPGVIPSGHEEDVHARPPDADRLLRDASDRRDGAVQL